MIIWFFYIIYISQYNALYSKKSFIRNNFNVLHYSSKNLASDIPLVDYIKTKSQSSSLKKWNSTFVELKKLTKEELRFLTRSSFDSKDYFEVILKNGYKVRKNPFEQGFILSIACCLFLSVIVLPQIPINSHIKSFLGLFFIFLPFIYIAVTTLFPTTILQITKKLYQTNLASTKERLSYHEAGHFLVGYICGFPVLHYEVQDDDAASLTLATSLNTLNEGNNSLQIVMKNYPGSLLVISMAGIVAESLIYGNAIGGASDWPFALSVLNSYHERTKVLLDNPSDYMNDDDKDAYLRGAVAKALVLLRLHRNELNNLAKAMREGKTVMECVDIIESTSSQ